MRQILNKIHTIISKPEMKILPGNLAFFLVLSIIPVITLIGVICSNMNISIVNLTSYMNEYFPAQVSNILIPFLNGEGITLNVIIFMIIGFYIASDGTNAIIVASNQIYEIQDGNYVRRRIKAFNMIILLTILIIFMLIFLAFGSNIMQFLVNNVLNNNDKLAYYLYFLIKWPIGFIFIFLIVKIIYTIAPDKHIKSAYVNRGAAFTTTLLILSTYAYGYYATNIANYNLFYGNLSSIIVLMFWLYLTSYIFTIGMVINATTYKLKNTNQ